MRRKNPQSCVQVLGSLEPPLTLGMQTGILKAMLICLFVFTESLLWRPDIYIDMLMWTCSLVGGFCWVDLGSCSLGPMSWFFMVCYWKIYALINLVAQMPGGGNGWRQIANSSGKKGTKGIINTYGFLPLGDMWVPTLGGINWVVYLYVSKYSKAEIPPRKYYL